MEHLTNLDAAQRIDDRPLCVGLRRPYLPQGCDYQGRHPEAAHAASEIEDIEPRRQRVPEGGAIGLLLTVSLVLSAAALVHLAGWLGWLL